MNTSGGLFGSLPAPIAAPSNTPFGTTAGTGFTAGSTLGFNLGTSTSTPSASVTGTPATLSTGFSLGSTPSSGFGIGTAAPAATANPPAAQGAVTEGTVSFSQMEETIHKWSRELVEQERVFLNQMDQVRDWDRLLISTGDKIVSLNDGMQRVKTRQQQLDHELDFIVAQQRELSECLEPLEKEFSGITVSDPERDSVYQSAENLNTQLQQISEDLKGVIEHINERNRSQDTTDPIVQIGRILNAHMNSLQWVDQNASVIQQMLDQIGKMREIHRRDADSSQNL